MLSTALPRHTRLLVAALLAVFGLAACGEAESTADTPAPPRSDAPTETASAPTPLEGISVAVDEDGTRTVTHDRGEVTVPAELPVRIAVTGDPLTDSLVSLGVTPTAATGDYGSEFTAHLADELDGVELIQWADNGVNIEQLAASEPDLIITESYGTPDESWDAVSRIAPTISVGDPWSATSRDVITALGMMLGLEDEADAAIADYETAVADAKDRIADRLGDRTVALVLVYPEELRLVNDSYGYLSPVLFEDLGLTPFEYPGDPESISPELIGEITADVVIMQSDADGTDLLADVLEQPLVTNLPASQSDSLYVVENPTAWQTWSAVGLTANTAFLDDLVELVAD